MPTIPDKQRQDDPRLTAFSDSRSREEQAFAALDGLARQYLGRPLGDDEATAFANRLDHALATCLRSFVALRRGQEQFRATLGLRGKPDTSSIPLGEAADDPSALAACLLGVDNEQATETLQQSCKAILLQQMGLVSGILAGLTDLLAKLSPAAVRQQSAPQTDPAALWETYQSLHTALARNTKETFEKVFGPHFAHALTAIFGHTN